MANEISYQLSLLMRNGSILDQYSSGALNASQTTAGMVRNVVTLSDSAPMLPLDLGGVATPGWAVFVNLEEAVAPTSNYIMIGASGTIPFLKLKYGEQQMVRLSSAPYAWASTGAAMSLFYIIYAD